MIIDPEFVEKIKQSVNHLAELHYEVIHKVAVSVITDILSESAGSGSIEECKKLAKEKVEDYFSKNDIPINRKSSLKKEMGDDERCEAILRSGKSQGNNCNNKKKEGYSYCGRHLSSLIKSKAMTPEKKAIKKNLRNIVTNVDDVSFKKFGNSNVYVDDKNNLVALKEEDGTYVVGARLENGTLEELDRKHERICITFDLKHNKKIYDEIMKEIEDNATV
jgi:hypothetical protein